MSTTNPKIAEYGRHWEQWHPYVLSALAAAAVCYWKFSDWAARDGFKEVLQAAVNLSAIAVGFLATAKSILFAVSQKEVIAALKKGRQWNPLIDYIMSAIYCAFLLAVVSSGLLLVNFKQPEDWHKWAICAWSFCLIMAFVTSIRVIRFFSRILKMD